MTSTNIVISGKSEIKTKENNLLSKEQQDIVLNPVKTTSKDLLLIMKENLKSFKVTIILVYLSVIRNEVQEKKIKVC